MKTKKWGHRTVPPEETLASVKPHFSTMGITRLADVTGLDHIGIPVAQAVRPMGRSLSVSQGKGMTWEVAAASAAMEAAETWHAEHVTLPAVSGRAADLPGTMPLAAVEAGAAAEIPLNWIPATGLADGGDYLVPLDMVHMDFTVPPDHPDLPRSSNGLAAGNSWAEALASALHEVIERDCAADALYAPGTLSQRRVDASAIPALEPLIERIDRAGLRLELFDLTNDLCVPTFRARLFAAMNRPGQGDPPPHPEIGTGCHLDPSTAAIRAVTEAAQSRLTRIAGSRDDLRPESYLPSTSGNLVSILHMVADQADHGTSPLDLSDQSGDSPEEDVALLLRRLTRAGLSPLAVALTRREIGIPVAKVIVPGLGRITETGVRRGTRHGAQS